MNLSGKRVLVVGIARSGVAAAKSLVKQNARVVICDRKTEKEVGAKVQELKEQGAVVAAGGYPEVGPEQFDLVVASPGIPLQIPPFQQAFAKGVPVVGEVELAYWLKPEKLEFCAVTGTNGKTTTIALLEHIFKAGGIPTAAAGNIGTAVTSMVETLEQGIIALELSSFQLETIGEFRPHLCGIINITPDHLDRHKTMDSYVKAKANIFKNQTAGDYCVLNAEDPLVSSLAQSCPGRTVFFSNQRVLEEGAYINEGTIEIAWKGKKLPVVKLEQSRLRGRHNEENLLCGSLLAFLAGVRTKDIAEAIKTFSGVRHRMEEISTPGGVLYINDSKATNPDSAIKALESFSQKVILIAGGRNKGSQFDELARVIKQHVKELILIGESSEEIRAAVMKTGFANIHMVTDFSTVVQTAAVLAQEGDVVMLSPACASWDMFDNYEQRGDLFCQLVRDLTRAG
ncbi:MAG: UDP-N-acetylmuramoyl-L-alanine--D-glutamate ligase [Syntrophomonas sp.]